MANVTNVSISSDNPQSNGDRYVTYQYNLLDNQSIASIATIGPKSVPAGFDALADAQSLSDSVLLGKKEWEQEEFKQRLGNGEDPLHTDMGGWFEKKDPAWGTWEEQFIANARYYWSLEFQLDLLPFADCWGRVSTNDKKSALGVTNQTVSDMSADMQTAVNTQVSLAAYTPYFTDD